VRVVLLVVMGSDVPPSSRHLDLTLTYFAVDAGELPSNVYVKLEWSSMGASSVLKISP
jgi:hypothetical protein